MCVCINVHWLSQHLLLDFNARYEFWVNRFSVLSSGLVHTYTDIFKNIIVVSEFLAAHPCDYCIWGHGKIAFLLKCPPRWRNDTRCTAPESTALAGYMNKLKFWSGHFVFKCNIIQYVHLIISVILTCFPHFAFYSICMVLKLSRMDRVSVQAILCIILSMVYTLKVRLQKLWLIPLTKQRIWRNIFLCFQITSMFLLQYIWPWNY